MKNINVAINGFGRIGRLVFRNLIDRKNVTIKAINDISDIHTQIHLLKYDTAHGKFLGHVSFNKSQIIINETAINTYFKEDPSRLPWQELDIDVVLECTGLFRSHQKAYMHLIAGAKRVILSAPGKDESIKTIVLGVNDNEIDPAYKIYSNASCTTNCLAPILKVITNHWGMEKGTMTTVHAFTSDQRLQDAPHIDLRRARAASMNIIPTGTGAATAVAKVIPQVAGKLDALALRVPVITGSVVVLNCIVKKKATRTEINDRFEKISKTKLKGILEYTEAPLVSSDIIGNQHSCIFDATLTNVNGSLLKVVGWYDNEAGYAARLADLTLEISKKKTL